MDVSTPTPYGAIPSSRQLSWHELEFYGFLHFTVNTFTDKEWGYGDESPQVFAPTDFDADRIVSTAAAGGMAGLILTCKHHDGFCLWPSRFTDHSVRNSAWRNGQGDVVREVADACAAHGLKFGVYLSPWDRNHAEYGRAAYIQYYRNQLEELLTDYGPLFEVWFDGANGGDGYYGGAREQRKIDARTYYDWPATWEMIRRLQPDACIFGDIGPDVRWVGNEQGTAGDPCWHTLDPAVCRPAGSDVSELNRGQRTGSLWAPAECDVSIRPGWFYHQSEDDKVRSPRDLLDLYFKSVGRGASLLLNLPPDRRGRIHEADASSLLEFRQRLNAMLATDLAKTAKITAGNSRGDIAKFAPRNLVDGSPETYWSTNDEVTTAEVVLAFPSPVTFDVVSLAEFLPLGQRVDRFAIDVESGGVWRPFAQAEAVGRRRLIRSGTATATRVRLRITGASACPALSEFALFRQG